MTPLSPIGRPLPFLGLLLCLFGLHAAGAATVVPFQRSGPNLVVSFQAQTQLQLVLEGKSGDGWKPLAVQYAGKGIQTWSSRTSKTGQGMVTFPLPAGYAPDQLRVVQSPAKFPAARLRGPKDFPGAAITSTRVLPFAATTNIAVTAAATDNAVGSSTPVVESDIWKLVGNQLLFFNQYRGLQVFDLTDRTHPVRTGGLRLPASGEQFYALDPNGAHLALLGHEQAADGSWHQNGAVWILAVQQGVPSLLTKLNLPGPALDSRLIGSRLYVASSVWNAKNSGGHAFPKVVLQAFELSNPARPVELPRLEFDAPSFHALQGNSQTLLLATSAPGDWSRSAVHVIDISGPGGNPALLKTLIAKGSVADSFKLDAQGNRITAVSHQWVWSNGVNQQTWVETFSRDGAATTPLAQLELEEARGESLHATRFDGDKLYVVTFETIDPLFIVDLSDPAAPAVRSHLEVPGWSTYLEPYGDRLLAVGIEDGKVTVSLFDVADPAQPSLLSRVPLGEGSSWSEANYDEKAANFLQDRGVALVPYQTWGSEGWQSATAVLEISPSEVTLRSAIVHDFSARRAAFSGDHIVSISGQELVVEDGRNLSALNRVAQLSLAWQVDRVLPFGAEHIIQIEDGQADTGYWGWGSIRVWAPGQRRQTMLRISPAQAPDDLVEELEMGPGRVIGAVHRDGKLYLGQYVPGENRAASVIRTWMFDASAPPELTMLGHTDAPLTDKVSRLNLDSATAVWADKDTLVWHIPAYAYFFHGFGPFDLPVLANPTGVMAANSSVAPSVSAGPIGTGSSAAALRSGSGLILRRSVSDTPLPPAAPEPLSASAAASSLAISPGISLWRGGSSDLACVMVPVAVEDPQAPFALPVIPVRGPANHAVRSSVGRPFGAAGLVYVSYQEDGPGRVRAWLQVIDFRGDGSPVVRDRVSLPGELVALGDADERGAVLLTLDDNGKSILACAYDGVSAYRLAVWTSPERGLLCTAGDGARVFIAPAWGRSQLTSLGFDVAKNRFRTSGTLPLTHPISELAYSEGWVLAGSYGHVSAVLTAPSGTMSPPRSLQTPGSFWLRIERASGLRNRGVCFPAGAYGVEWITLPATHPNGSNGNNR